MAEHSPLGRGHADRGGAAIPPVQVARGADLAPEILYELLRLRVDVFVVEQACPYPELDGRDLDPHTLHLWVPTAGALPVLASARVLKIDSACPRIGRVATRSGHRGHGYAAALLRAALDAIGTRPSVLDAQAHLEAWYERFGFARDGDAFVEDDIPHVPMRRPTGPAGPAAPRTA